MRTTLCVAVMTFLAASLSADVKFIVKRDGTKVIYNLGGGSGKGSDFTWLAKQHDRRSKYDEIIERYAEQYRVDPVLVRAVIQVESNFNPGCVSNKGARGLMQLIPATARRFGVDKVHDPEQNIRGGVRYLSVLLRMFSNDLPRALAAYNAGEGAVQRYGGIPPYSETQTYVQRALTVYYGRPYGSAAVSFAGRRGGPKLKGGFGRGTGTTPPIAASMIPGVKFLGTR
jgi:hypothetical protein